MFDDGYGVLVVFADHLDLDNIGCNDISISQNILKRHISRGSGYYILLYQDNLDVRRIVDRFVDEVVALGYDYEMYPLDLFEG